MKNGPGSNENAASLRAARVKDLKKCNPIGRPLTREAALQCAKNHWKMAVNFQTINNDSAFAHCMKGLSIYENGSLFSLKAQLLMKERKFAAASQAAECSIARNDYWDQNDLLIAYRIRYLANNALYRRYPSSELLAKVTKAKEEMEIMTGGMK
jgi:hypothetical protein